jgi:hypothetical protein
MGFYAVGPGQIGRESAIHDATVFFNVARWETARLHGAHDPS